MIKGVRRGDEQMLGFIRFISFLSPGDSKAVKGLKDGVASGGF